MHLRNSVERVPSNTAPYINARIKRETSARLSAYQEAPSRISERLRSLDDEWDIERAIQANAATLSLAGVVLATVHDKRWLALPALVGTFLLQHAIQGWCPPVPVLRRLGFRTPHEIESERYALKALRGDFRGLDGTMPMPIEEVEQRVLS